MQLLEAVEHGCEPGKLPWTRTRYCTPNDAFACPTARLVLVLPERSNRLSVPLAMSDLRFHIPREEKCFVDLLPYKEQRPLWSAVQRPTPQCPAQYPIAFSPEAEYGVELLIRHGHLRPRDLDRAFGYFVHNLISEGLFPGVRVRFCPLPVDCVFRTDNRLGHSIDSSTGSTRAQHHNSSTSLAPVQELLEAVIKQLPKFQAGNDGYGACAALERLWDTHRPRTGDEAPRDPINEGAELLSTVVDVPDGQQAADWAGVGGGGREGVAHVDDDDGVEKEDGHVYGVLRVPRVLLTPTRWLPFLPTLEASNRILRQCAFFPPLLALSRHCARASAFALPCSRLLSSDVGGCRYGVLRVPRVLLTPTRWLPFLPTLEASNRILRQCASPPRHCACSPLRFLASALSRHCAFLPASARSRVRFLVNAASTRTHQKQQHPGPARSARPQFVRAGVACRYHEHEDV